MPNPLFDLAGIMCGQFGVPFWKFFLATLIGKAIIKTHIQVGDASFSIVSMFWTGWESILTFGSLAPWILYFVFAVWFAFANFLHPVMSETGHEF